MWETGDQEVYCETVSPNSDREATARIAQQNLNNDHTNRTLTLKEGNLMEALHQTESYRKLMTAERGRFCLPQA